MAFGNNKIDSDAVPFINPKLCDSLRKEITDSLALSKDESLRNGYNLLCAAMDRIDTSAKYLNTHSTFPATEEDFICFLVFSCMIVEGVKKLLERLVNKRPSHTEEKRYFKQYCMGSPMYCTEEECPTDDKFFEYLRSLAFAHPYETSHNKILKEKFGCQVSPWVVVNKYSEALYGYKEPIGVKIYTEKKGDDGSDYCFVMFSFLDLKQYIVSRYEELADVIEWVKKYTLNVEESWKKNRINRNQSDVDILREIKRIEETRFRDTYEFDEIIDYMECPVSDDINIKPVMLYRSYLSSRICELCDAVDALDYEKEDSILYDMVRFRLENMHQGFHYQMEKIFTYLNDDGEKLANGSNEQWGLMQAVDFYEQFGKKWVYMRPLEMCYTEIHLLVVTACYLEYREQQGIKKSSIKW